jgi:hypothetical protein
MAMATIEQTIIPAAMRSLHEKGRLRLSSNRPSGSHTLAKSVYPPHPPAATLFARLALNPPNKPVRWPPEEVEPHAAPVWLELHASPVNETVGGPTMSGA